MLRERQAKHPVQRAASYVRMTPIVLALSAEKTKGQRRAPRSVGGTSLPIIMLVAWKRIFGFFYAISARGRAYNTARVDKGRTPMLQMSARVERLLSPGAAENPAQATH